MTHSGRYNNFPKSSGIHYLHGERELDPRAVIADVLEELLIPDPRAVADAIVEHLRDSGFVIVPTDEG